MSLLQRFGDAFRSRRDRGLPTSSNRASSLHLRWEMESVYASSAAVTLEIVEPPAVDRLYFWALQASFVDGMTGLVSGGAHLGLQWHPDYPGKTAVNWGGYRSSGGELEGTDSDLPSALGNVNTRNFVWRPGVRYRLVIDRGHDFGWWRGSVRNETSGERTVVRDLHGGGDTLHAPVMWSEVFARCDDPPVAVRWSQPQLTTAAGIDVGIEAVAVNYQAYRDGGCTNTASFTDGAGFVQRTNTNRSTPQGTKLVLRDN